MIEINVIDDQTGKSLPNAHVYPLVNGVPDYSRGSSTNIKGITQLNAGIGESFQVTFLGYHSHTGIITDWNIFNEIIIVRMDPSVNALGEAVVSTTRTPAKKKTWEVEIVVAVVVLLIVFALLKSQ